MKIKIPLSIALFLFIGCGKTSNINEQYLQRTSKEWKAYLRNIGMENPKLNNQVFLITYSTTCPPCLNEIRWWNQAGKHIKGLNIALIVLEKYKSSFNAFLKTNNFDLSAYRDSAGIIFKYELIPYPPVKIFFNNNSEIAAIEHIGTNGHLTKFVKLIKADK